MKSYIDDSRIHEGHRQRMREKLLAHGQRIFHTYELLEMLLYHVVPYKDTNPIAKRLLHAFSDLDGVLSAEKSELVGISGVGERCAEFISLVGELGAVIGAEFLPKDEEDFSNYDRVGKYFVELFRQHTQPAVVALLLDNNMHLIEAKKLYSLEYSSGGVRPKPFIDAALAARASVVISAHNHLHGPFCPSQGDRATNEVITEALAMAGVLHAEHYVICADSYCAIGAVGGYTKRLLQPSVAESFLASLPRAAETDGPPMKRYSTRHLEYFVSLLSFVAGDDAGELADRLLSKYLTIENLLCANESELSSLFGEKLAFFVKLLAYVSSRRITEKTVYGRIYTRAQIADYLKALFIGDSVEKVYLLTYAADGALTGCEMLGEGTVNASEVMPRKAIELALKNEAKSVALAHNHPFGRAEPSAEDLKFTNAFGGIFAACDISFTTHYIVAGQACNVMTIGIPTSDRV